MSALTLPSLNPVPDDIETQLKQFLLTPGDPALEDWLLDLIKNSGHLSTAENLRWRVFVMVWLAGQFDVDKAWPYLMWFNMSEPVISDHVCEMLVEGANELHGHVQLAIWTHESRDERFVKFMSGFQNVPGPDNMPPLLAGLLSRSDAPETEAWLSEYLKSTLDNHNSYVRPWRLVAAAWYATRFNAEHGLFYLQKAAGDVGTLSASDQQLLREYSRRFNGLADLIAWRNAAEHPAVQAMLADFELPNPDLLVEDVLNRKPDYRHLAAESEHATEHTALFERAMALLQEHQPDLSKKRLLNLGCGPLAPFALLLSSQGYKVQGVDVHIPPRFLPTSLLQKLKQRSVVAAWEEATEPYYNALAAAAKTELKWNRVQIELAATSQLPFKDRQFEVILSLNHLHHAEDLSGLLTEAARVLKPGGFLLGQIRPFAGLRGLSLTIDPEQPWRHLRQPYLPHDRHPRAFNRWREADVKTILETHFELLAWQEDNHPQAADLLRDDLQAHLSDYTPAELCRDQIFFLGRKA